MKWLTALGALTLSCASVLSHAQSSDTLSGTTRLACEAILCLSSSLQPGQCKPSLNHYFDIRKYRRGSFSWGRTIDARRAFLGMCPVSSTSDMRTRIEQISQGAGRCDADYLNSTYAAKLYRYKIRRDFMQGVQYYDITTVPTVLQSTLPSYCVAYNDHAWTYDLSIRYVGNPLRGGYWVDEKSFDSVQAKWQAQHTGSWAEQWHYALEHPRNGNAISRYR